jgi:hypothetical protein
LKNDKTIIAYHFGQYYCLLQKEWRLPKIEIDWLIKVLKNGCFHNGPVYMSKVSQGRQFLKLLNTQTFSKFWNIEIFKKFWYLMKILNKKFILKNFEILIFFFIFIDFRILKFYEIFERVVSLLFICNKSCNTLSVVRFM